jgi:DNA processing protein
LEEEEILATLALQQISGIGSKIGRMLIDHFKSSKTIFETPAPELLWAIYPVLNAKVKKIIENIPNQKKIAFAKAEAQFLQIKSIAGQIWDYRDVNYPSALRQIDDLPLVLFSKGSISLAEKKIIGIVGTRDATAYGQKVTEKIIAELADGLGADHLVIVSGLAHGIDRFAHQAALQHKISTLGVLAHGLDRIYPLENQKLAENMLENGGLITEYPFYTEPKREHFPKRNRIVAGMCSALIVVESKIKGGSMITANRAFQDQREVFAVLGKLTDDYSAGCNALIQNQKAHCFVSTEEFINMMNWEKTWKLPATFVPISKNRSAPVDFATLPAHEQKILQYLQQFGRQHLENMTETLSLLPSQLSAALFNLEMQGLVKNLPGKMYEVDKLDEII